MLRPRLLGSPSVALLVLLAALTYVLLRPRAPAQQQPPARQPAAPAPAAPFPPSAAAAPAPAPGPAPGPAPAPPPAELPYVDIVIAVTSPWMWVGRRLDQYRNFVASLRRSRFTAKLLFVMGDTMVPDALNEWDQDAVAHPHVAFVTARGCPDADTFWPGATDGAMFPPANSSTTCKVLEGASVAVERFRFRYFARIGDDAYLRWDHLLGAVAPTLPASFIMGRFSARQGVFAHLTGVFGAGLFLPYPLGMGYVMTHDVAAYLREGYRTLPRLTTAGPEDAAIALHLYPLNTSRLHSDDFHDPTDHACTASTILVHYVTQKMVRGRQGGHPKGSCGTLAASPPYPLPPSHPCTPALPPLPAVGVSGRGRRHDVPPQGQGPARPEQGRGLHAALGPAHAQAQAPRCTPRGGPGRAAPAQCVEEFPPSRLRIILISLFKKRRHTSRSSSAAAGPLAPNWPRGGLEALLNRLVVKIAGVGGLDVLAQALQLLLERLVRGANDGLEPEAHIVGAPLDQNDCAEKGRVRQGRRVKAGRERGQAAGARPTRASLHLRHARFLIRRPSDLVSVKSKTTKRGSLSGRDLTTALKTSALASSGDASPRSLMFQPKTSLPAAVPVFSSVKIMYLCAFLSFSASYSARSSSLMSIPDWAARVGGGGKGRAGVRLGRARGRGGQEGVGQWPQARSGGRRVGGKKLRSGAGRPRSTPLQGTRERTDAPFL